MKHHKLLFLVSFILIFGASFAQTSFDTPYGHNDEVGKFVEINGAKIYFEEYGEGDPLLLIHGCGADISSMANQIDHFRNKYRVIVADSRGQGRSELKTDSLTYDQMTSDWEGLVNHLKLDSVNVLGWSDGGIIALKMAVSQKADVKKIIAMGANLRPDTTAVNAHAPAYVKEDLVKVNKMIAAGDTSQNWNLEKQLNELLLYQPNISHAEVQKINVPVLVMVGDRDIIKNEHAVEIYNNLNKGQLCIMPGLTHVAPRNNPEIFNAIAERFLSEPFEYK